MKRNLADLGIVTQCIAPTRINDQYLTNVLLKINTKLGGMNSFLAVEYSPSIPMVSRVPTIIIGMACHTAHLVGLMFRQLLRLLAHGSGHSFQSTELVFVHNPQKSK
jgi:hypothetical protein